MLIVIVTITGRSIYSTNSYCDINDNNGGGGGSVCSTNSDVTITRRSLCSASSYCDNNYNNGELYV